MTGAGGPGSRGSGRGTASVGAAGRPPGAEAPMPAL